MKKENLEFLAATLGILFAGAVIGGLVALFFNYVIVLFFEYPFTLHPWSVVLAMTASALTCYLSSNKGN
jgi:ABC-type antimicrobial peptide transport system permease subunit